MLIAMLLAALQPGALPPDFMPVASDSAVVDRVPLELHRLHSPRQPEEALALWTRDRAVAPPPVATGDGWQVVSRRLGTLHETLQARPDGRGGSDIVLSRVDLGAPLAAAAELPFDLPAGGEILRTIGFDDAGGHATQFIVSLAGRPAHALRLLCARLLARGWRLAGPSHCETPQATSSRWFMRGEETLGVDLRLVGAGSRAVIGHVVPRP